MFISEDFKNKFVEAVLKCKTEHEILAKLIIMFDMPEHEVLHIMFATQDNATILKYVIDALNI
jgi:hypothetical protein